MSDTKRYRVIEAPHSISHHDPDIIGRRAAYDAAMKLGDRIAIYEWDGRRKRWILVVDRTVPNPGQLPKRTHVRNALRVVELVPQLRQVPGRGWAPGYLVPAYSSGNLEYPPVSLHEAYQRAREMFGADVIVKAQ